MSKFNTSVSAARSGVIATTGERTLTAEGGPGFVRDAKSELFLLAVGSFFGEDKFYESGDEAADRFRALATQVTKEDSAWMREFLPWLRHRANIRTAALVGAAEYIRAGGAGGRYVVRAVLARADEPGEILAYWTARYGRRYPQPLKRGVADAVGELYKQPAVAKWDSSRRSFRFADVIELTHPKPLSEWRSALYKYLLDERRGRGDEALAALQPPYLRRRAEALRAENPRAALLAELVDGNHAVTWETVSSAGTGKLSAVEWMTLYKHMGYMAKLRNLRNLDEAGVPLAHKREIGAWLADPANVQLSKQLPMRFLSAYGAVNDNVWSSYLSEALDHSLAAVPQVPGKWLVLVDASGSMSEQFSKGSSMSYYGAASVFAAAFAGRNDAQIRTYSNALSPVLPEKRGESTLQTVERLQHRGYWHGGGTATVPCLEQAWNEGNYDHVLLITDEQYNGYWGWRYDNRGPGDVIPKTVPLYTFNVAGYAGSQTELGMNRITIGGLSDAAFTMIATVESARGGMWPWEA